MRQVKIPGGNSLSFSHLPNKYHWFKFSSDQIPCRIFTEGILTLRHGEIYLCQLGKESRQSYITHIQVLTVICWCQTLTSWSSISQSHIAGNTYIYEVQFHTLAAGIPLYRQHRGVIPTSLAKNIAPYSSNSTTLKKKS